MGHVRKPGKKCNNSESVSFNLLNKLYVVIQKCDFSFYVFLCGNTWEGKNEKNRI